MVKVKLYLSMIIVILSTFLGTLILLDEPSVFYNIAYAKDDFSLSDLPTIEPTTETTTSTTKTTTTTKRITTTKTTSTTRTTTTIKQNNDGVGTINISNYNKTIKIKKDDSSGKLLNGNTYGMIDYRLSFDSPKMIIYGHSNKEGTGLFQVFQNYDGNKEYYNNHKYITINYDNNIYKYEIFSVYNQVLDKTPESNEYYLQSEYGSARSYNRALQGYKNNSEYDTGISLNADDKILIIQTCSMNPNYKAKRVNLLIMAKLISESKVA